MCVCGGGSAVLPKYENKKTQQKKIPKRWQKQGNLSESTKLQLFLFFVAVVIKRRRENLKFLPTINNLLFLGKFTVTDILAKLRGQKVNLVGTVSD